MALYGVHRVEKYKKCDISGIQNEANRTADKYNNDVDITRIINNIYLHSCNDWKQKIDNVLNDKKVRVRKDSNVFIGAVYTASSDFFKGNTEEDIQNKTIGYFCDCYKWHLKHYCNNDPNLMITCVIHLDETTPHMQVYSIPLVENKGGRYGNYSLSAKALFGNKKQYVQRVDDFYKEVSSKWGLERGEPCTDIPTQERKKHIETQRYKEQKLAAELDNLQNNVDYLQQIYNDDWKQINQALKLWADLEQSDPDWLQSWIDIQDQQQEDLYL